MNRYYPWVISGIACIVLLVSNGMSITGLSVYDEALLDEFGWSRGELKFRDMVTFSTSAILAPFGGIFLDRLGVRRCMLAGWLILGGAYLAYSQMDSLTVLYLVHAALGLVLVLCGLNPAVILVSSWFEGKRGVAIGIALVGTSLGGMVFPQYGTLMAQWVGWREAMQWAIVFPACMFALVFFIVRDLPGQLGMEPVREIAGGGSAKRMTAGADMGYLEALKTPTFWALAITAMTTFYTVLAVQAHLFLYMRDLSYDAQTATNAISAFFACAVIGKFVFGLLSDYLDFKRVFLGNVLVMLAGASWLAFMHGSLIWLAVAAFGLGWGGVYTTLQLSAVNCFGLKSAGKILGTITVLDCFGGGLGIWLTGEFYTRFGNYDLAFQIFVALIFIATVAITQVRRPEPRPLQAAAA
ncbi:MFS transporter [Parahaliea maris]|uniref:MFS transporter n=1 Tax=Parahaliea maris TaxID=2716870 RepID=A0A5C8ZU25_9GAMM|nr:MFS transporter [Parahaliea maris]TXS91995.1 MFS transporter [Parahaliea maris]